VLALLGTCTLDVTMSVHTGRANLSKSANAPIADDQGGIAPAVNCRWQYPDR
jgi:hypothetical protein